MAALLLAGMKKSALDEIQEKLGCKPGRGYTEISRTLKDAITPAAVQKWKQIPTKHVLALEKATGVSRYRQRPDVYGPEPK